MYSSIMSCVRVCMCLGSTCNVSRRKKRSRYLAKQGRSLGNLTDFHRFSIFDIVYKPLYLDPVPYMISDLMEGGFSPRTIPEP